MIYKYYLAISLALLVSFIVLAPILSPRISDNKDGISSGVIEGDEMIYLQLNDPHFDSLNQIMLLFSQYGRGVAWTLSGVLLFVFGGWTGRKTAIVMAITMLILIPIGTLAKETVGRPRPATPEAELLMAPDNGYSYPSGHAVIVSSGAAIMLMLYRESYKKLAVSIGLAVEAALVCFSRVYIGDHYPLDIAGGIFLGAGVAFLLISITKYVEQLLQPLTKMLKP